MTGLSLAEKVAHGGQCADDEAAYKPLFRSQHNNKHLFSSIIKPIPFLLITNMRITLSESHVSPLSLASARLNRKAERLWFVGL